MKRVARINSGSYYALKGHIAQSQGRSSWNSTLRSGGSGDKQGGGWSLLSEAKSLKTNSKKAIRLKSTRSDGSRDSQVSGWSVWVEADSQSTFSDNAEMRVGQQL
jgi:hypothetical protein